MTLQPKSSGSARFPGGLLQWQWSGQSRQEAIEIAEHKLQQQRPFIERFLQRHDDLITIFLESLLHGPAAVNASGEQASAFSIDSIAGSLGQAQNSAPVHESATKASGEPEVKFAIQGCTDSRGQSQEAEASKAYCKSRGQVTAQRLNQSADYPHQPHVLRQQTMDSSTTSTTFAGRLKAGSFSLGMAPFDIRLAKSGIVRQRLQHLGVHFKIVEWAHWFQHLREPPRESRLARFVHSNRFEFLCIVVVIANTGCMIASTNYGMNNRTEDEPVAFRVAESCFLIFYAIEILLKIAVHGFYFWCNENMTWNTFDTSIVVFSVVNSFILASVRNNLAFLRTLRILKLSRLFRVFKVIVILRDLRLMLTCIVSSLVSLMWCFALLALIGVVFAIFFVQALTRYVTDELGNLPSNQQQLIDEKFSSVQQGMSTLFMMVTGGLDWAVVYSLMSSTGPVNVGVLLFFIGFFHVSIVNIVTGMFVEKAMKYGRPDHDIEILNSRKEAMNRVKALKDLCQQLDMSGSGRISRDDFMLHMEDATVRFAFSLEGMEIRDAEAFFDMLATLNASDDVDIETFVAGCLRMRGNATSIDLQTLGFELKRQQLAIEKLNREILAMMSQMDVKPQHRRHRQSEDRGTFVQHQAEDRGILVEL